MAKSILETAFRRSGCSFEGGRWSGSINVDRRISDSLAIVLRLVRRNGIVDRIEVHHSFSMDWVTTIDTHAIVSAIKKGVRDCNRSRVAVEVGPRSGRGWVEVGVEVGGGGIVRLD